MKLNSKKCCFIIYNEFTCMSGSNRRQAESDADMTYDDFYVPSENSLEISSNESDTDL